MTLILCILIAACVVVAFGLGKQIGNDEAYDEGMRDALRIYGEVYMEEYYGLHEH